MNDKPVFRIGAAGLDPRDLRLIEIVFKHSRYNKYEFRLIEDPIEEPMDILIANSVDQRGLEAVASVRKSGRSVPVIAAVSRGATSAARHAISIERLTLQLLPILNRVVELDLQSAARAASAGPAERPSPPTAERPVQASGPTPADTPPAPSSPPAMPPLRQPTLRQPTLSQPTLSQPTLSQPTLSQPTLSQPTLSQPTQNQPTQNQPAMRQPPPVPGRSAPLPAPQPQPQPQPARSNLLPFPVQNPGEGLIAQRLKVLVVDDSPTVRRQLSVAFDRLGLACEPVASAAEALDRLAGEHFDLALVDVVMPEMDGYKLTREIKRNKHLKQMPVIILTSRSSPFDLARGALAGCDTYLTKPVPFRALEAAVVRLLRKSLAIDELTGLIRTSSPGGARVDAPKADRPPEASGSRLARLESRFARLFKR